MNKSSLYIGLMSGTSADGIDLALVDFSGQLPVLVAKYYQEYDQDTHQKITALYRVGNNEIDRAFALDVELAHLFAKAIQKFIKQERLHSSDIIAIGNHGQTIRHRPSGSSSQYPFTLQIGCNHTLATLMNIRVIGQFRRKDMALGGQGAPLVPAFHNALFADRSRDVFVVNIGGISNITYLPTIPNGNDDKIGVLGFDTGPGNALMDDWYQKNHHGRYDKDGNWAAQGTINNALLQHLLADEYFQLPAPKSTGREVFHLEWLFEKLSGFDLPSEDIQATLAALTSESIAIAIKALSDSGHIYLCGGGVQNKNLCKQLNQRLSGFLLSSTEQLNIDSDALEAMAFAWFAYAFDQNIIGNIPAVTGASKGAILGSAYIP